MIHFLYSRKLIQPAIKSAYMKSTPYNTTRPDSPRDTEHAAMPSFATHRVDTSGNEEAAACPCKDPSWNDHHMPRRSILRRSRVKLSPMTPQLKISARGSFNLTLVTFSKSETRVRKEELSHCLHSEVGQTSPSVKQ